MKPKISILCVLSKFNYREKNKGTSAEYNIIYLPLKKKFKKSIKFINSADNKYKEIKQLNEYLINCVKKNKPKYIFLSINTYEIYLETLIEIKKICNCKIINWFTDDSWRYEERSIFYLQYVDFAITNHFISHIKNKKKGVNSIFTGWGCPDHWISKNNLRSNYKYEVTFIGNNYFDREKYINFLKDKGIKIKCFGNGWQNSSSVTEKKLLDIIKNSKISLNFSRSRGKEKQTKARVFEITGVGGFCLTENSKDLRSFFKSDEVVSFSNELELYNKIRFFLKNENLRNKIAKKSNYKTRNKFKNSIVINRILKIISKTKGKKYFNTINYERKKNSIFIFKILKSIAIIILKLFLNQKKSIKVIRRIFFEIEWRLRGSLTYTKNGICSNIFNFD